MKKRKAIIIFIIILASLLLCGFGAPPAKEPGGTSGIRKNVAGEWRYVGSRSSKKFHWCDCPGAQNVDLGDAIWFNSRATAISSGYTPCKECNP